MKSGICPKCQSQNIIPHVRILDYFGACAKDTLKMAVYEEPDALLFKGEHKSTLSAWVCGECGYTELFVDRPQELLAVYHTSSLREKTSQAKVATAGPMWTCPNCGGQIEHNLDVCWNCGTDRDGTPPEDPNAFDKLKGQL